MSWSSLQREVRDETPNRSHNKQKVQPSLAKDEKTNVLNLRLSLLAADLLNS